MPRGGTALSAAHPHRAPRVARIDWTHFLSMLALIFMAVAMTVGTALMARFVWQLAKGLCI